MRAGPPPPRAALPPRPLPAALPRPPSDSAGPARYTATPAVRARRRRTTKGMAARRLVYPRSNMGKREDGSRRCPSENRARGAVTSRPPARSRIAATARVGAAARARRRAARPSALPARSARAIRSGSSWSRSSAATRSCSALTIALGFLLTRVILKIGGVAAWDQRVSRAARPGADRHAVDLSWVGSTLAGGLVIPALVGVLLVVFLLSKHWRLAAFTLFVICVESGTYRANEPRRSSRPARRAAAREPARRRELPVGAHGSLCRAASAACCSCSPRGSRTARCGSCSGRSPSRSRRS